MISCKDNSVDQVFKNKILNTFSSLKIFDSKENFENRLLIDKIWYPFRYLKCLIIRIKYKLDKLTV